MNILNFGSLNLDHVYQVDHFVRPGETLSSGAYRLFCGGKGHNQSIALARAGAAVFHAGRVGAEGAPLLESLRGSGVDTRWIATIKNPTGHAIIQVNREGENAIVLYGGANRCLDEQGISKTLAAFAPGDLVLLQNEVNLVGHILQAARSRGLKLALNPAPMDPGVPGYPLEAVDVLFVNEIEGQELSGETSAEGILDALRGRFKDTEIILTLGAEGAMANGPRGRLRVPAQKVRAVDTTAAGDTLIGYYLAGWAQGLDAEENLRRAVRAATLCVTRAGAADSIPYLKEL